MIASPCRRRQAGPGYASGTRGCPAAISIHCLPILSPLHSIQGRLWYCMATDRADLTARLQPLYEITSFICVYSDDYRDIGRPHKYTSRAITFITKPSFTYVWLKPLSVWLCVWVCVCAWGCVFVSQKGKFFCELVFARVIMKVCTYLWM